MHFLADYETPLGPYTAVSDGDSLLAFRPPQEKHALPLPEGAVRNQKLAVFQALEEWLNRYFDGQEPAFLPPLAPEGSAFRQAVWQILLTIPYGGLTTYGQIARQIAQARGQERMSAQAVGGAVGHNPISILIPCHRVVGQDGSLTGYGGGLAVKQALLALEGVDLTKLYTPKRGTAL